MSCTVVKSRLAPKRSPAAHPSLFDATILPLTNPAIGRGIAPPFSSDLQPDRRYGSADMHMPLWRAKRESKRAREREIMYSKNSLSKQPPILLAVSVQLVGACAQLSYSRIFGGPTPFLVRCGALVKRALLNHIKVKTAGVWVIYLCHPHWTIMSPSDMSASVGAGVSTISKCSGPGKPSGMYFVRVTVLALIF